jgi:hypothetical protein
VPPFVSDLQKDLQSAADEAFKDVQHYVNFTLQVSLSLSLSLCACFCCFVSTFSEKRKKTRKVLCIVLVFLACSHARIVRCPWLSADALSQDFRLHLFLRSVCLRFFFFLFVVLMRTLCFRYLCVPPFPLLSLRWHTYVFLLRLQKAYFKCAYECFDLGRSQQQISHCVERCSAPVVKANSTVQNEMARFQVSCLYFCRVYFFSIFLSGALFCCKVRTNEGRTKKPLMKKKERNVWKLFAKEMHWIESWEMHWMIQSQDISHGNRNNLTVITLYLKFRENK